MIPLKEEWAWRLQSIVVIATDESPLSEHLSCLWPKVAKVRVIEDEILRRWLMMIVGKK